MVRPTATLGLGVSLAGIAGTVALLAGRSDTLVTVVVVGGGCLGLVAGSVTHRRRQPTPLLGRRAVVRGLGLIIAGLAGSTTLTGLLFGGTRRYLLATGCMFVAVVGWSFVWGASRATADNGETLAMLPSTAAVETDSDRRHSPLFRNGPVVAAAAFLLWRAVSQSSLTSGLLGALLVVFFLPEPKSSVQLTETGLVTTRYVVWVVPATTQFFPWEALYGYEVTDSRLRIVIADGRSFRYDLDRISDADNVRAVFDDQLPTL